MKERQLSGFDEDGRHGDNGVGSGLYRNGTKRKILTTGGNRNAWVHSDRSAEAEAQLKTIRQIKRTLQLVTKLKLETTMRGIDIHRLFDLMIERDRAGTDVAVGYPGSEDHSGLPISDEQTRLD